MSFRPRQDFALNQLNTLGVSSRAEYFYAFKSLEDLNSSVDWARSRSLSLSILGGGSNALLPENISGLVLQPINKGKIILEENEQDVLLKVRAGENWHEFVLWTLKNNYYGLENLSLIPGLVGASPIQNIGAYGVEVASFIEYVTVIDVHTGELFDISNVDCDFAYRDSIFKQAQNKHLIITDVSFRLSKRPIINAGYPAITDYLDEHKIEAPTPKQISEAVIAIRSEKLPSPQRTPNAGSFFKNPIVKQELMSNLLKAHLRLPHFPAGENMYKIPAAWLIDKAGWKGKEIGGISVHQKQALVLVNPKLKPLGAILAFAEAVQADISARFSIKLEIEPQQLQPLKL